MQVESRGSHTHLAGLFRLAILESIFSFFFFFCCQSYVLNYIKTLSGARTVVLFYASLCLARRHGVRRSPGRPQTPAWGARLRSGADPDSTRGATVSEALSKNALHARDLDSNLILTQKEERNRQKYI